MNYASLNNTFANALRHAAPLTLLLLLSGYSCQSNSQQDPRKKTVSAAPTGSSKTNSTGETTDSKTTTYPVTRTDAEWKERLTSAQYYVLRKAGTEIAFTSPLLEEKRQGTFVCAGCGTALYRSQHKYESYSGWPSFDRPIDGNVGYDVDYKIGYKRTEVHCSTCGGHLGHVFPDGPQETTGLRHCINGVALEFIPDEK